jgi:hypothetical protein
MAREPTTEIRLGVNFRKAIDDLKKFSKSWGSTITTLNQGAELMGRAWGAVAGSIGALVNISAEWVELAQIQEAQERKLTGALKARGKFTEEAFEDMKAFTGAMQQQTGIGDDYLLGIQAQLVAMGVQVEHLKDATKQTIGLAEVTGNAESAARLVAGAHQGAAGRLARYGIVAKTTAEAQEKLNDLFVIAAERSNTFETRVTILQNNVGDLKEELGFVITKSTAVNGILETLSDTTLDFTAWLAGKDGKEAVNAMARSIAGLGASTIDAVLGMQKAIRRSSIPEFAGLMGLFLTGDAFTTKGQGRLSLALDAFRNTKERIKEDVKRELTAGEKDLQAASDALRRIAVGKDKTTVGAGSKNVRPRDKGPDPRLRPAGDDDENAHLIARNESLIAAFKDQEDAAIELGLKMAETEEKHTNQIASNIDRREALRNKEHEGLKFIASKLPSIGSVVGGAIENIFQSIGEGENVLANLDKFFGGLISSMGSTLIQIGTAAVAAGTLGTVVPWLAPETGGPLGVGAGLAAIGVGAGLVAAGAALGGGSGASAAPSSSGGSASSGDFLPARSSGASGVSSGFSTDFAGPDVTRVYNLNFGGFIAGSKAEVGRAVKSMVRAADRLGGAAA